MSATSFLLLFMVLLSLLVCDSRYLGANEKEPATRFTTSSVKIVGRMRHYESNKSVTPKGNLSTKENGMTSPHNASRKSTLSDAKTEELNTVPAMKKKVADSERKGSIHRAQDGSLVSVSWRVPRKKPSKKHPGFNSDYSPPKTHPPSHN